jgi:hypothetical protein
MKKYDELINNIVNEPMINYIELKPHSIGVILNKSNDLILLQNKIIENANNYDNVLLTFFIEKKNYVSNNITFIKCWRKRYLFGNSLIKIPSSIKSVKIKIRDLIEEEYINYNIIL